MTTNRAVTDAADAVAETTSGVSTPAANAAPAPDIPFYTNTTVTAGASAKAAVPAHIAGSTETASDAKSVARTAAAQQGKNEVSKQSLSTAHAPLLSTASQTTPNVVLVEHAGGLADTANHEADTAVRAEATAYSASAQATFAALDAADGSAHLVWKQAGPHTAEAGYQDPALGWIGVRAQQDASGVHATIVPVSQDAAQSLGTHLAGLNTYLAEQQMPVHTVTVSAAEAFTSNMTGGQSGGQPQDQGSSGYAKAGVAQPENTPAIRPAVPAANGESADGIYPYGSSSAYISVMA